MSVEADSPRRSEQVARLLGDLGISMLAAGYAVTDVAAALNQVASANGTPELRVGVMPAAVFVDDPGNRATRFDVLPRGESYRFDQTQLVGAIVADAAAGEPIAGIADRIAAVDAIKPRYPLWAVVLGNGLMAAGISVVFGTTWPSVAADFALGLIVGVLLIRSARLPGLAGLLPFFFGFASAFILFGASHLLGGTVQFPLYAAIAPIVVLVPGATITNGVLELAAGDVVSGGGRMVSGFITWLMLVCGIVLGATAAGTSVAEMTAVSGSLDPALGWVGVLVMGVGVGLQLSAPPRLMAMVVLVLIATYAIIVIASPMTGGIVASGIAAAVLLPVLRGIEARRSNLPVIVTFRPCFWLLVPGSLGLGGLIKIASGQAGAVSVMVTVFGTIMAISIGAMVGAAVSELFWPRARPLRSAPRS